MGAYKSSRKFYLSHFTFSGIGAMEHKNIHLLTLEEKAVVEAAWTRKIRRSLLTEGVLIIAFLAYGFFPKKWTFPVLFLSAFLVLVFLFSLRDLKLIFQDIHGGIAEEILGSALMNNNKLLYSLFAFLGHPGALATHLIEYFLKGIAFGKGDVTFSVFTGRKLFLIRPDAKELICVDEETYRDLGDGVLVKALILPASRVAFKVNRPRLDTL